MSQLLSVLKKAENQRSMDKALLILRSYSFVFFTPESFAELYPELGNWIEPKHRSYSVMIHEKKPMTLKEPGEYDVSPFYLLIKLNGKKTSNIHVYEDGKYSRTIKKPWKDAENILWRKVRASVKFPDAMTYDERRQWRAEAKKVAKNPNYEPSDFYLKWTPQVEKIVHK